MKIKSIKTVKNEPVYNLTIRKYHNFIASIGIVLKNCDALRYYCVNYTSPSKEKIDPIKMKFWMPSELEDFKPKGYKPVKKISVYGRR